MLRTLLSNRGLGTKSTSKIGKLTAEGVPATGRKRLPALAARKFRILRGEMAHFGLSLGPRKPPRACPERYCCS